MVWSPGLIFGEYYFVSLLKQFGLYRMKNERLASLEHSIKNDEKKKAKFKKSYLNYETWKYVKRC